ncbi:hypothetical protein EDB81DRAFT_854496 [Dactylonectria macrodidyma]|uniref:DUF7721 domain-containing protein n=1 Tax=Dactylonectria macrodidyma TaxID=307937 RepID=A0A9P9F9D8_9HYPO|nr:hypothetical protein EDB81DRAFT_854496 [Dactylonectria macrodidyma]
MDSFINRAKDLLDDDKDRKEEQQYPAPGSNKPAGGIASFFGSLDYDDAKEEASKNAGSSGDKDYFGSILQSVSQKKVAHDDLDEEDAVNKHKKTYDDDDDDADENSLGTAAALQALKLFNKGEATSNNSQSAYLGLAMSEASKLFDDKSSKDKVSSGTSKDAVVQKATEVAMKMYLKSQGEQQGGLVGLASKFMK